MKKYILILLILMSCNSKQKQQEKNDKVTVAYKIDATLGEGAIWNYKTNELYWIDIEGEGKSLNIFNPKTKENRALPTPSEIGTVVPKNENEALVALTDGLYSMNLKTGKTTLFSDMRDWLPDCRLNDGKCDPSGRLWVGSMHWKQEKGKAKLFCVKNDGSVTTKVDSVTISNGIVWTEDKKTMYYIDTPTSHIKAYDYNDETGNISNERVAVEIAENLGYPDGMAIDAEGMVWVGMWNGNAVLRFNPKTGKLLQKIEVPAHNVTSCAFGGDNLETLYITSSRLDMSEEELKKYPLAGSLFQVNPGVKGVKSNFFK